MNPKKIYIDRQTTAIPTEYFIERMQVTSLS